VPGVPKQAVILLSGIPATGKSSFARYLALEHRFAHYELECYPKGWPHPELKGKWDTDRSAFVAQARQHHDRIALDWGFPVSCIS
jgi:broad-specificity NMP kinase